MERYTILSMPHELCAMICQHLAFKDLRNLAKVHRYISDIATVTLFRQDAATCSSSAILWAASASGVSIPYAERAVQILERSIRYGGDVNAIHYRGDAICTAIHVAVAHGHDSFARALLNHGANINTFSIRLWEFLNVGRFDRNLDRATVLRDFARNARIQDQCWLPLLPAMLRSDFRFAELLIQRKCSGYLALHRRYLFMPPLQNAPHINSAYTIHHMLVDKNAFPKMQKTLFQEFPHEVTLPEPGSGMSPLMKAICKGNELAVDILFSFPQDLDAISALGWSTLCYAVEGAAWRTMPKMRDWSAALAERLVEAGAGVNIGGPSSPLQLAVTSVLEDDIAPELNPHTRRMKQLILRLLDNGADVNVQVRAGVSLGQDIFLRMQQTPDRPLLRSLFTMFLDYRLRVNDLFPDGTSIFGQSLASRAIGKKIMDVIVAYGARPAPDECDHVLYLWWNKDKILPKQTKEELHLLAPMFSQPAVDRAFLEIVLKNDAKQFDSLSQWRQTSQPDQLMGTALREHFSRRQALYALSFNPRWQNQRGQGYAHIILEQLSEDVYTEREAIEDIKQLIAKGMRLDLRDCGGKTALQRLTLLQEEFDEENVFGKLEKLLMRSRLKELGDEI